MDTQALVLATRLASNALGFLSYGMFDSKEANN
jgi:hypothetical protein